MKKIKIVHIIDSLLIGGAETLVAGYYNELNAHNIESKLIALQNTNKFKHINIDYSIGKEVSTFSIISQITKIKKFVLQYEPDIIHTHLPLSTFVVRLLNPKIPILFSVHNQLSKTLPKNSFAYLKEKFIRSQNEYPLFVSKMIANDYMQNFRKYPKHYQLYNYIEDVYFQEEKMKIPSFDSNHNKIKLIAVGSLKEQKNYHFLLESLSKINPDYYQLDVYGAGVLKNELEQKIDRLNLKNNITLKGQITNLSEVLSTYDAFVSASSYEGFGIAPIEALSVGLPALLSDIDVYKEVAGNHALFFSLNSNSFERAFLDLHKNYLVHLTESIKNRVIFKQKYNKQNYIHQLVNIYHNVSENSI